MVCPTEKANFYTTNRKYYPVHVHGVCTISEFYAVMAGLFLFTQNEVVEGVRTASRPFVVGFQKQRKLFHIRFGNSSNLRRRRHYAAALQTLKMLRTLRPEVGDPRQAAAVPGKRACSKTYKHIIEFFWLKLIFRNYKIVLFKLSCRNK